MKLINANYEILKYPDLSDIWLIEKAGRICYKSEDKVTDDSYENFLKGIIERGHEAVLEHSMITVKFICDRGVSHELVRHRLASFCQECLTGDTLIKVGTKTKSIKDLYDRKNDQYGKTHNKTINIKSVTDEGLIINNKLVDIFYKGKNKVYEVTTKLGYKIKCTLNHKFLNKDKHYVHLKDLKVNDFVYVNGRNCLIKCTDEEFKNLYLKENLSPIEISERLKVSYSTILNKLKSLNIFEPHKNDKNKEKYNINHTKESYQKISNTIKNQYDSGYRIVWNKGIKENQSDSVKRQADNLRKNHHNNGFRENNSGWKGGPKERLEASFLKKDISECEICKSKNKLEVHHKDKNINNNSLSNLIKVCNKCHHLLHHGWFVGTKIILDEIVNISFIGVEDTYDIEMESPYNNYIANGFIVHNSTRYCNYSKDKFDNQLTFIIPIWLRNKIAEGSYFKVNHFDDERLYHLNDFEHLWMLNLYAVEEAYNTLTTKAKWTPGQARSILPNSLKTEVVMTANVREWRHILKLRTSNKAHEQMRELMLPLLNELQQTVPVLFDDIKVGPEHCENR